MEFETVIEQRFSCRSYFEEKLIPEQVIRDVIRLSQRAPSAGNLQAFRVVVVRNPRVRKLLAQAARDQTFLAEAPVVLVISAAPSISNRRYRERGRTLYSVQDATIFTAYLQLACTNVDLASVWVGAFSEHEVISTLKDHVEAHFIERPIALIAVGYSTEDSPIPSKRIPFDQLVASVD